ncbi:class I SAM-dependent methyltransferase [Ulvibacter litoralis]|uniref:Methyltransferase domain-containing protein n=1 Tax=Ulvibacter litoralis TaxID=227084 RepID=A0A1G7GVE5_9FLAO|nr:methyltransferase domain-containing protein [Ulvibacter litoralis]GHC60014.1 hypothetical protein GCM10008083_26280 [Ulvibacter litoralis]SDE91909.1 Methyltransferase domain-containing protein [Ulvibacter litoralis]
MKEVIYSPLVPSSVNVKFIETFESDKIISNYQKIGIDVERFFDEKGVSLYECLETSYRFYYPYSTIGDAAFYEDLSAKRQNYYSNRWEHGVTLKYLDTTDSVLEIGSGFGAFLDRLKARDIKSKGLELNPLAVKECVKKGLNVTEKLVQQEAKEAINKYSVVCCFQVLEHITGVNDFIAASVSLLDKKGRMIIGVPNNNPYLFINDKFHTLNLPPHHAGLWNGKSLKSLERVFPLKLISLEFEPLKVSYSDFLTFHLNNANCLVRTVLKLSNKLAPNILKKILCKFIKGRNVLAVFEKVS